MKYCWACVYLWESSLSFTHQSSEYEFGLFKIFPTKLIREFIKNTYPGPLGSHKFASNCKTAVSGL
jgi:hypothetical protein